MTMNRRRFLSCTVASAAGAAVVARAPLGWADAPAAPLEARSETQLFIDDAVVARSKGLQRRMHQPTKKGLIQEADGRDWERGGVYIGKGVFRDQAGKFHMTYRYYWWDAELQKIPAIGIDKAHWFHETVGYATSDDGIRWHKPDLGRFEAPARFAPSKTFPFETPQDFSRHNNFGYPIVSAFDLAANGNISDPAKRFLFQVVEQYDATHPFAKPLDSQLYFAADWPDVQSPGWKDRLTAIPQGAMSPRGFNTLCGYDHDAHEWFMTCQNTIENWVKHDGREIARYSSPDLISWAGPELVLPVPAEESRDPKDWVEYMDLWGCRVGGEKSGAWLGMLMVFHSDRSKPEYQMPKRDNVWRKGTTELRLVMSRDAGHTWQPVGGREPWIPCHPDDNGYDRLVCCTAPVRVGDELRFYYACWNGDHLVFYRDGSTYYPDRLRNSSTAWAALRLDGYVSLDGGDEPGELVTKPMLVSGKNLAVNLSAPRGALRAALCDATGKPLDGCTLDDCIPVTGDGVSLPVRWRTQPNLTERIAGKPVTLRLVVQNGELYSFQFS